MNDQPTPAPQSDPTRSGLGADTLRQAVLDNLVCLEGRSPSVASARDWYMALAYTVRDRMLERWTSTVQAFRAQEVKLVCYFSAEFLIGPQLANNLVNLGIEAQARVAMQAMGQDLDAMIARDDDGVHGAHRYGALGPNSRRATI